MGSRIPEDLCFKQNVLIGNGFDMGSAVDERGRKRRLKAKLEWKAIFTEFEEKGDVPPFNAVFRGRKELKKRHLKVLNEYLAERKSDRGKPRNYIWRTRGDSKVRSSHRDRDGKIFSWDNPPEGGHPGEAPGCRCWAEPTHIPTLDEEAIDHVFPELLVAPAAARAAGAVREVVREVRRRVERNKEINKQSSQIADGHAYDKHVIDQKEFPDIKNKRDLAKLIKDVIKNADEVKDLDRGRKGYWDARRKIVVVHDPNRSDSGTVMKSSKRYFDKYLR